MIELVVLICLAISLGRQNSGKLDENISNNIHQKILISLIHTWSQSVGEEER